MNIRAIAGGFSLALLTVGCANLDANLAKVDAAAKKYGPIIGRDILMVADILVQAECSPALSPVTGVTNNVLNIVAPSSSRAAKVQSVLNANLAVAAQLCPLVASITAAVGPIPAVKPSQIILSGV